VDAHVERDDIRLVNRAIVVRSRNRVRRFLVTIDVDGERRFSAEFAYARFGVLSDFEMADSRVDATRRLVEDP
jgi:hypothetical protein